MNKFILINGIKVEFTKFGVKIYTRNYAESVKIHSYMIKEGIVWNTKIDNSKNNEKIY